MFKFNNNHIFTGYLKQVLSSFHLPKCKIYTKDQAQYAEDYKIKIAEWHSEIQKLQKVDTQLQADLREIAIIKESNTDTEYIETIDEIESKYEDELSKVKTQIEDFESKIANTPKELNVIATNYHSSYEIYPGSIADDLPLKLDYNDTMRYIPYIKEGRLQLYSNAKWYDSHTFEFDVDHTKLHTNKKLPYTTMKYSYGQKILNYTKNLKIQNTIYDSYTHEYLGDYLRFHRDFANINLMPLYNCFSNRACPHLDLKFTIGNNYEVKFKTDQSFEDTLYKYYMVPVKFFKNYTIAIDSSASVEMCCCIYDEYYNTDIEFVNLPKLTYQCFSDLQFKAPVLYTKIQNLTATVLDTNSDLCQYEDNLKLIIKLPANNNSSIVILEGDYTTYNDNVSSIDAEGNIIKETNKTVINYQDLSACDFLADKLITPLQLLRTNTGESYPFADRLVEYLSGNAITVNEPIADNITRAKTIIGANCHKQVADLDVADGIWEPILQCMVYDYINENKNLNDINHDILGFIDKDVEKWYSTKVFKYDRFGKLVIDKKTNKPVVAQVITISNSDIYND